MAGQLQAIADQPREASFGSRFTNARAMFNRARHLFEKDAHGTMQYRRVLGWGGYGIVQLWSVIDPATGNVVRDVAIKFGSSGKDSAANATRNEIMWMRYFRNAEHIIQLAWLRNASYAEIGTLYNREDAERPTIVMEAEKFSMRELINNINASKMYQYLNPADTANHKVGFIPSRILWRMFLCLARGIIGMAYPPPSWLPGSEEYRESVNAQGIVDELPQTIVHFDLDPQNVLVGDVDLMAPDEEHRISPLIKIADLGLMTDWDSMNMPYAKMYAIRKGKTNYYAPEQRDRTRAANDEYVIGHPLNVWAIGLTMFNLLTLRHPNASNWKPSNCTLPTKNSSETKILTWGWQIIPDENGTTDDEYIDAYDLRLRQLIALCMADHTAHRPDLATLLTTIEAGIQAADARRDQAPPESHYVIGTKGGKSAPQNETAFFSSGKNSNSHPRSGSPTTGTSKRDWVVKQEDSGSEGGVPVFKLPPGIAPIFEVPPDVEDDELIQRWISDYIRNAPTPHDPYAGHW
ncbi:kinase-like domain-containing protein [Jackrogersella minutella]|nr:kinase-like domain-containing protein [Jackrogersella minutella]